MLTRSERLRKAAKNIQNRLRPASQTRTPVFLLGEMRSGTNMLTECFDHTPGTEIFNEHDDAAFEGYELRDLETTRQLIARSPGSHVIFKAIADSARAEELLASFPRARVIWIYRRYQDVVNSALRKWQQHNEYLRLIVESPKEARWRARYLTEEQTQLVRYHYNRRLSEPSARSLIWYVRNIAFFTQRLDGRDDVMLINYEHLVSHPTEELARALRFVGLPFGSRSFSHVNMDSINRDPSHEIDADIAALCDELMDRLNATCDARRIPIGPNGSPDR